MKKEENNSFEGKEEELNSAELELLRASLEESEDRSDIPSPRKKEPSKVVTFAKKNRAVTVIISVFAVALVAMLVFLCIYLAVSASNKGSKRDYVFTYEKFGEKPEEVKYKYESIVINDVLYVDMNKIAEFAEISVSGSATTRKYWISDTEYMKFTHESEYAVINASKVSIPAPAIVEKGKCLVPYEVISKAVESGLSFKRDMRKNRVTIKWENYSVEDVIYNEDITFSAEDFDAVAAIVDTSKVTFEYNTDVSKYLSAITPQNSEQYLLLVNKQNPLSADFVPSGLSSYPIPVKYTGDKDYYLDAVAANALIAMLEGLYAELPGNGTYVTSAYRDYAYQVSIFEKYVKAYTDKGYSREDAEAEVLKTSALPGTSEHQSALCVDFITTGMKNGLNNADFEKTSAFAWLSENAYKYGFILRYPENKTDVTSYSYESWHFRFVGRDAATAIYFSGICLEEYLEII